MIIIDRWAQKSIPTNSNSFRMNFWGKVDALMFPHDFTTVNGRGNCCLTPCLYTGFRALIFVLCLLDFVYCAYFFKQRDLVYFTNWGLVMTLFCSSVLFAQNLFNWCFQGRTPFKYWKMSHSLFTMTLVFEILINGVYWGGLFPYSVVYTWSRLGIYDIVNPIMAHAVPALLLLTDLQFNLVVIWNPIYIPFYLGLLFVYLIVNCVYSLQVSIIYDMMTYKNWITYLFLFACVVVVLIGHILLRLYCKFCKQQSVLRILDESEEVVNLFDTVSMVKPNENNLTTMTATPSMNKKFDTTTTLYP